MVLEKATTGLSRSLKTTTVAFVVQFATMLQTLWSHAALPVSGGLVIVKHTVDDEVLELAPVADIVVLAPFFFGLLCMQQLDKRRGSERAEASWGSPIYHLCL